MCSVNKDVINECIAKMLEADGILLGSPTYFADISAGMKALIERCGMVSRANGDMLMRKGRLCRRSEEGRRNARVRFG